MVDNRSVDVPEDAAAHAGSDDVLDTVFTGDPSARAAARGRREHSSPVRLTTTHGLGRWVTPRRAGGVAGVVVLLVLGGLGLGRLLADSPQQQAAKARVSTCEQFQDATDDARVIAAAAKGDAGVRDKVVATADRLRALAVDGGLDETGSRGMLSAAIAYDAIAAALIGNDPRMLADAVATRKVALTYMKGACR